MQRLPIRTVVEGNPDARFRASVEETFALGIFAHRVNIGIVRQAGDDFCPRFAEVGGFENIEFEIVELVGVHGDIGGS